MSRTDAVFLICKAHRARHVGSWSPAQVVLAHQVLEIFPFLPMISVTILVVFYLIDWLQSVAPTHTSISW
jgi:hypothetical protein